MAPSVPQWSGLIFRLNGSQQLCSTWLWHARLIQSQGFLLHTAAFIPPLFICSADEGCIRNLTDERRRHRERLFRPVMSPASSKANERGFTAATVVRGFSGIPLTLPYRRNLLGPGVRRGQGRKGPLCVAVSGTETWEMRGNKGQWGRQDG